MDEKIEKKILYVEDEPTYLRVVSNRLQAEGYKIIPVNSGEAGVSVAETEHPDVVILDIKLPGMNGWEVLKQIRQNDWCKRVPVLMLTSIKLEKPQDDLLIQTTMYLEKADTDLEDLVRVIDVAYRVFHDYIDQKIPTWDVVTMTNKIKVQANLLH